MKKGPNPKVYFALAGLTLAGGMGFLFVLNKGLGALRSKVAQMGEQVMEQHQLFAKLSDSKKSLEDLKSKLAHLEQGVPEAAYLPGMLKELEDAGKANGIEVTGVRPMTNKGPTYGKVTDPNASKPYQPLDLELKGKGHYADLVSFVRALNVFPKIVAVRTVGITPPALGQKGADDRLDLTLGLRAFVFKQGDSSQKTSGGRA